MHASKNGIGTPCKRRSRQLRAAGRSWLALGAIHADDRAAASDGGLTAFAGTAAAPPQRRDQRAAGRLQAAAPSTRSLVKPGHDWGFGAGERSLSFDSFQLQGCGRPSSADTSGLRPSVKYLHFRDTLKHFRDILKHFRDTLKRTTMVRPANPRRVAGFRVQGLGFST
eukprot:351904-Chlamydomonas_euryale.AAC.2